DVLPTGDLVVRDLAFSYPGAAHPAFSGLNLTLPAGARVWLRGDSGSGKSTFIDLLHRHFEPSAGWMAIGGVNLQLIDRATLRRHVVVVSQEAVLFTGSLRDNIRYGRPDARRDEVERAAQAAGVRDFLSRLPDGLDAMVGPRGASLSGGERQRVALARALLMSPALLVIDEGTSSLDGALELRTLAAIDALLPQATRIVVSHRDLSQLAFDRVIDFPQAAA
uniref:ATP-binding cassette domain-containing protein n=1 Tax=Methyloversatilis discipulorum TaxID=1119528 RepID=UPI003137A68E